MFIWLFNWFRSQLLKNLFRFVTFNMASGSNFDEESTEIEGLRDEALLYVDQALALEETNHTREVLSPLVLILFQMDVCWFSILIAHCRCLATRDSLQNNFSLKMFYRVYLKTKILCFPWLDYIEWYVGPGHLTLSGALDYSNFALTNILV